ncbi:ankyrin repeat domain-containing protein 50-like isoform X2 [Oscarella lobularis]|uniref:ankyrin repeat domain-containing protein 50-like isoform X2 n=1 Tax=Oscarella lobularis TaxID=121494 RepID=UPI0033142F9E
MKRNRRTSPPAQLELVASGERSPRGGETTTKDERRPDFAPTGETMESNAECRGLDSSRSLPIKTEFVNSNSDSASTFLAAIRAGDLGAVRTMTSREPAYWKNAKGKDGGNSILRAAESGNVDLLYFLIQEGCDVHAKTECGRSVLSLASQKGKIRMVKELIEIGFDTNETDENGETSLHWAARCNRAVVADFLIRNEADIEARNVHGLTPLHLSARERHSDVAAFLLSKRANIEAQSTEGMTPVLCTAKSGSVDLLYLLIQKGCNIHAKNKCGRGVLSLASQKGHIDMVKELIEIGFDVNEADRDGRTSLHWAASYGQTDVEECLLENGANIEARDNRGMTSLLCAIENGHLAVVRLILAKQHNYHDELVLACATGHADVVELLASKLESDLFKKDCGSLLHLAAQNDFVNVARVLISKGATYEAIDEWGCTPFLTAVEFGCDDAFDFLIDNSDLFAKTESGESALDLAVIGGRIDFFRRLRKAGLGLDRLTSKTRALLKRNAKEGNKEAARFLKEVLCDETKKKPQAPLAKEIQENEEKESRLSEFPAGRKRAREREDSIGEERRLQEQHCSAEVTQRPSHASTPKFRRLHEDEHILPDAVRLTDVHLGTGAYGEVRVGHWQNSVVAVKTFHAAVTRDLNLSLLRQEMESCGRVRHPNIVSIYDVIAVNDAAYLRIVMNLLEGSLSDVIGACVATTQLTLREKVELGLGFASGVAYLHQLLPIPLFHGNIRSTNILVTATMEAQVGDLESMAFPPSRSFHQIRYVAPERLEKCQKSTAEADIYSLGVTLSELMICAKSTPAEQRLQIETIGRDEIKKLCLRMVELEPSQRPNAPECLGVLRTVRRTREYCQCPPRRMVKGKSHGQNLVTLTGGPW